MDFFFLFSLLFFLLAKLDFEQKEKKLFSLKLKLNRKEKLTIEI